MQGYGVNIAIRRGQRFGEISGHACALDAYEVVFCFFHFFQTST